MAIPIVCRQWREVWCDDALWSRQSVHHALGSPATRASAAALRHGYSCGWQAAWRAALVQRRNWQLGPSLGGTLLALRKVVAADSDGLTSLDCDAAFQRVAVGCFAQSVCIYALPSPQSHREHAVPSAKAIQGLEQLCVLPCHADTVWDVRWHGPDQLITGSFDGTIALHDVARAGTAAASEVGVQTRPPLLTLPGHGDRVMGVFSCGPNLIASAGRDGTVRRWDVRVPTRRCVSALRDDEVQRSAYCVTQSCVDEHKLVSGHDGTVAIWDCRRVSSNAGGDINSDDSGGTALVEAMAAHTRMVMDVQLDESLHCLATASRDDTTKLWNWSSLTCATVLTGQVGVRSVQFDSEKIVTAANDRSVAIWKYPAAAVSDAGDAVACGYAEPEPDSADETDPLPVLGHTRDVDGGDDDGGGTQPRLRAITPPRAAPAGRGLGQAATQESLSPLRTTATSGVERRPLFTLKHSAQVPRARFRKSDLLSATLACLVSDSFITELAAVVPDGDCCTDEGALVSACVDKCVRLWSFDGWLPQL